MALLIPEAHAVTLNAGDMVKPNASSSGYYVINNTITLTQLDVNTTDAVFTGLDANNQSVIAIDGAGNFVSTLCRGQINCTIPQTNTIKNVKFTETVVPIISNYYISAADLVQGQTTELQDFEIHEFI